MSSAGAASTPRVDHVDGEGASAASEGSANLFRHQLHGIAVFTEVGEVDFAHLRSCRLEPLSASMAGVVGEVAVATSDALLEGPGTASRHCLVTLSS